MGNVLAIRIFGLSRPVISTSSSALSGEEVRPMSAPLGAQPLLLIEVAPWQTRCETHARHKHTYLTRPPTPPFIKVGIPPS